MSHSSATMPGIRPFLWIWTRTSLRTASMGSSSFAARNAAGMLMVVLYTSARSNSRALELPRWMMPRAGLTARVAQADAAQPYRIPLATFRAVLTGSSAVGSLLKYLWSEFRAHVWYASRTIRPSSPRMALSEAVTSAGKPGNLVRYSFRAAAFSAVSLAHMRAWAWAQRDEDVSGTAAAYAETPPPPVNMTVAPEFAIEVIAGWVTDVPGPSMTTQIPPTGIWMRSMSGLGGRFPSGVGSASRIAHTPVRSCTTWAYSRYRKETRSSRRTWSATGMRLKARAFSE